MNQEPKINNLLVKNFQELQGFGGKKYLVYIDPNNSNILADDEEYEIYKNMYQKKDESKPNQNDLGFNVAMKKNKPVNITKEQKKIQQRIQKGEDKSSKITVCGSQFISDIFEGSRSYDTCQMCESKELIISDKEAYIKNLEAKIEDRDKTIQHLHLKIAALEKRALKKDETLEIKRIKAELDRKTFQAAQLQVQNKEARRKIDNFSKITQSFKEEVQLKALEIKKLKSKLGEQSNQQKSIIISVKEHADSIYQLEQNRESIERSFHRHSFSSQNSQMSLILIDSIKEPIILDLTKNKISAIRENQKIKSQIQPIEDTIRSLENLSFQSKSIRSLSKSIKGASFVFE